MVRARARARARVRARTNPNPNLERSSSLLRMRYFSARSLARVPRRSTVSRTRVWLPSRQAASFSSDALLRVRLGVRVLG